MTKPVAIVAGYIIRHPVGGQISSQLQYVRGLRQLGYEVVWAEHFGWPNSCYDPNAAGMTTDPRPGIAVVGPHFARVGLTRWCYVDEAGRWHGMTREELARACREATLLLSVAGTTWLEEFRECRTRVFIDTDPAFTQMRMPATPAPSCAGYASPWDFAFVFTCAERMSRPDCLIPTHGLPWRATRWPIALDSLAPRFTPDATRFTTVGSWSAYGTVTHNGATFGQKDIEFLKFIELPGRGRACFELALSGGAPREKLTAAGWHLADAGAVTRTMERYINYIGASRGEFSVAKNAYVATRSGWFSERTAHYLALGKPAIVQDTGFSEILPCGEGLFAFRTLDEAAAAIEEVNRDYRRHCEAARRICEEYFDARKVLGALLRECGLPAMTSSAGQV